MKLPPDEQTRRQRNRDATRRRLYEAAMAAFRRDGLERADVAGIAAAAGVRRTTFYFYFPTKDHVLAEWLHVTETRVAAAVAAVRVGQLRAVLKQAALLVAEEWEHELQLLPPVALVALRAACRAIAGRSLTGGAPELHGLPGVLATHFRSAAERGEIDGSLRPDLLAVLFLGSLFAAAFPRRIDPPAECLRALLNAAADSFLDGARARVGEGRADAASPDMISRGLCVPART